MLKKSPITQSVMDKIVKRRIHGKGLGRNRLLMLKDLSLGSIIKQSH